MRWVIAALVVLGLTVGIVLMWPSDNPEDPPVAADTTTTSTVVDSTTTSTTEPTQTTSTTFDAGSHVVETVEEAEAILRELWFGWFEGIYNQDEERIREVVATESMLNAGLNAFGELDFNAAPFIEGMEFTEIEILEASDTCLAVWSTTQAEFLGQLEPRSGVEVLRMQDGRWQFAGAWKLRNDLWEADCESELQPLP